MANKITQDQYQELLDAYEEMTGWDRHEGIIIFEKLTGIEVKPYTGYQFYDAAGNYLGDDQWDNVDDILRKAEIEVVEDGK